MDGAYLANFRLNKQSINLGLPSYFNGKPCNMNERTGEEERIPRILRARLQKSGRVSFFPVCCLTYVNSFIRETVKIMSVVKNGGDESEAQHVIYSVGFLLQEEERKLRVGLHTRLRLNLLVSSHTHSHISSCFSTKLTYPGFLFVESCFRWCRCGLNNINVQNYYWDDQDANEDGFFHFVNDLN